MISSYFDELISTPESVGYIHHVIHLKANFEKNLGWMYQILNNQIDQSVRNLYGAVLDPTASLQQCVCGPA